MATSNNKVNFTSQFLNSKKIEVEEQGEREVWWDTKINKFGVRVSHTGRKTFFVMYRVDGSNKTRRYTIGTFPEISLHDARNKAREVHYKASKGIDPKEEEQEQNSNQSEPTTFRDLAEKYKDTYLVQLADSTQKNRKGRIDSRILPVIGGLSPEEITPDDLEDLQKKVVEKAKSDEGNADPQDSRAGHTMANRVIEDVSVIFSKTRPEMDNPCKEVEDFDERKQRVPFNKSQIKTLWEVLETEPLVTGSIGKMALITGQRLAEIKRMEWGQIREDDVWRMTEIVQKSEREHLLPLPDLAVDVLEELKPETGDEKYVFQSPSPMNDGHVTSLRRPSKRIREKGEFDDGEFTYKKMRTTVRTNLAEEKVPPHIADRILNHSSKGTTSDEHYDAYYYIDEKKEALQKWANRLKDIIGPRQ